MHQVLGQFASLSPVPAMPLGEEVAVFKFVKAGVGAPPNCESGKQSSPAIAREVVRHKRTKKQTGPCAHLVAIGKVGCTVVWADSGFTSTLTNGATDPRLVAWARPVSTIIPERLASRHRSRVVSKWSHQVVAHVTTSPQTGGQRGLYPLAGATSCGKGHPPRSIAGREPDSPPVQFLEPTSLYSTKASLRMKDLR